MVMSCRDALSWIGRKRDDNVCLRWIPGHKDMGGNVEADGLATQASKGHSSTIGNSPLATIKSRDNAVDCGKIEMTVPLPESCDER